MRCGVLLVAVAAILVVACGSTVPRTDAGAAGAAGAGGSPGTGGMGGEPIGDSGVCFGDPTDPCEVCLCTNCGALTGACDADATCVTATATFARCAQTAPGTDAASLAQCRDTANATSPKAGPHLDCLIAACPDKCL